MKFFLVLFLFLNLPLWASDHDDGEDDLKGRALNLTDLFVFREDWQTGNGADAKNLIFIMNLNPRSLPGQQYFFSTLAHYKFHISKLADGEKTFRPTGVENIQFSFKFDAPDANAQQRMTVTANIDGQEYIKITGNGSQAIVTTNIANSKADNNSINSLNINGQKVDLFAGPREDPFFFDVEQFFKIRAQALANGTFLGFLPVSSAKDFTHNYNVLSIVMRVPIALLQNGDVTKTVFDVWETITYPQ